MRKLTWESMLDADMNVRYWGQMARKYRSRERTIMIFLAIISSGAVAGWKFWAGHPSIWHSLSGLSAVLAVALPLLDYSGNVATMVELRGKWSELSVAYDQMWAQYGANPAGPPPNEIRPLKDKEAELSKLSAALPEDQRSLKRCQGEVRRARGL